MAKAKKRHAGFAPALELLNGGNAKGSNATSVRTVVHYPLYEIKE
jgi:hypothetical protein